MLREAISAGKETVALAPRDVIARLTLVSAFERSAEHGQAAEVVSEIKQLDPGFSVARFTANQFYKDPEYATQLAKEFRSAGLPE